MSNQRDRYRGKALINISKQRQMQRVDTGKYIEPNHGYRENILIFKYLGSEITDTEKTDSLNISAMTTGRVVGPLWAGYVRTWVARACFKRTVRNANN